MIQKTATDALISARTSTITQFFLFFFVVQVIQFSGRVQNNSKGLIQKREREGGKKQIWTVFFFGEDFYRIRLITDIRSAPGVQHTHAHVSLQMHT